VISIPEGWERGSIFLQSEMITVNIPAKRKRLWPMPKNLPCRLEFWRIFLKGTGKAIANIHCRRGEHLDRRRKGYY
jgi:hypothetical protein